jgi:hypothetical protein
VGFALLTYAQLTWHAAGRLARRSTWWGAKQRVVTVAKAILKIAMDIVGVTSALDCFTTGSLRSCIDTGLTVLMSKAESSRNFHKERARRNGR